jgi:hypothetical protein
MSVFFKPKLLMLVGVLLVYLATISGTFVSTASAQSCPGCGARLSGGTPGGAQTHTFCSQDVTLIFSVSLGDGYCTPYMSTCVGSSMGCYFSDSVSYISACDIDVSGRTCGTVFGPQHKLATAVAMPLDAGGLYMQCGTNCSLTYAVKCTNCATAAQNYSVTFICEGCS